MVLSLTRQSYEPGVTAIRIAGRLALGQESGQIESALLLALGEGARRIVLDLSQVDYIDSAGIGIVTYCFNKVSQQQAQMVVAGAHGLVLEVFRVTRIDTMIPFYADLAAACASFAAV